jgi:hypothetical protein
MCDVCALVIIALCTTELNCSLVMRSAIVLCVGYN